jgi:DNA-binding transcriptional regulator YiaG
MVIVETSVFTRQVQKLLPDEDYWKLQAALVNRPNMGTLIKGTGGLRKLRWSLSGKGKRGGVRVIYYWAVAREQLLTLFLYPKAERDDLLLTQLKDLKSDRRGGISVKQALFDELVRSVREGGAILRGKVKPSRMFVLKGPQIKQIRLNYQLSQAQFAALLGISVGTLRNWEQGRRSPEGAARVLLQVAAKHPEAVWDAVRPTSRSQRGRKKEARVVHA